MLSEIAIADFRTFKDIVTASNLKSDKKYQEARQLQDAITHRLKLYAIEPQSYELM